MDGSRAAVAALAWAAVAALLRAAVAARALALAARLALALAAGFALVSLGPAQPLAAQGGRLPAHLRLIHPGSIAVDRQGAIYVAEVGAINKLSPAGDMLGHWGLQFGTHLLNGKIHLAVTAQNRVLVADGSTLLEVGRTGQLVRNWRPPKIGAIQQIATGADGHIVVANRGRLTVLSAGGRVVRRITVSRSGRALTSHGVGVSAKGTIFGLFGSVPSSCRSRPSAGACSTAQYFIEKLSPSGKALKSWPISFPGLQGLVVTGSGDVYVGISATSAALGGIARYSPGGLQETTWGLHDCTGASAFSAGGLGIDRQGNLYETDSYTGVVLKLSPLGKVLRRWGTCSE